MEYGILGPVRLLDADGRELLPPARHRDLLALLVVHAGEVLSADGIIEALWAEQLPANPGNALQQRVFHLRGLLDPERRGDVLVTVTGGYRLQVTDERIDARRFEQRAERGQQALAAGDAPRAARLLAAALAEWRGPALAEVDAPWAVTEAGRLTERRATALEDRIDADLALGRHTSLVAELEQQVDAEPLRERLRGQLMLALSRSGRQADALERYEQGRRRLADELGLDPSPALRRIHADVLTQQAVATAPSTPNVGTGLPVPASRFVGRERELEQLGELLRTERLVTITGPGGAGKTRLAIELAGRDQDATTAPVSFTDLSGIEDLDAIAPALAAALGLRVSSGADAEQIVTTALRTRPRRVVLDNAEQVLTGVAELTSRLLAACPGLQVLATSRSPLGIRGETRWQLTPLTLPPPDTRDLEVARRSDAVALLLDRLRAAAPQAAASPADAADLVRIVHQLDGLPLAIELAAARTAMSSLAEVAAQLDGHLGPLATGPRDAPDRHRTLVDALRWSFDLLDDTERRLWAVAAVPVGPFTTGLLDRLLDAADLPVTGAEAVVRLGDLSLLEVHERGRETRYRMLGPVRSFGREYLAGSDLEMAVRDAHATAVEAALAATDTSTPLRWQVDLDAQRRLLPDTREALRWRSARGESRGQQRLAAGIGWLCYLGEPTREGLDWIERALGPVEDVEVAACEPWALLWAAALRIGAPDPEALRWAELAVEAAVAAEDDVLTALAWSFVAAYQVLTGDPNGAREVIATPRPRNDGWLDGVFAALDGKLLALAGRLAEAEARLDHAQRILVDHGPFAAVLASDTLLHLAQLRGDVEAVWRVAARGIEASVRLGAPEAEGELRCLVAMVAAAVDDWNRAAAELARAAACFENSGLEMGAAMVAHADAYVALRGGDHDRAAARWRQALELHDWTGLALGRPFALWGLGHLALQAGEPTRAHGLLTGSLASAMDRGDLDASAAALEGLAAVHAARGEPELGARLLGASATRRATMGAPAPILTRDAAHATRSQLRRHLGADHYAAEADAGRWLEDDALRRLLERT